MEAAELRAISDTLIRIVRPEMTPKQLIKAARKVHPHASKKNIARAAFFLIISHAIVFGNRPMTPHMSGLRRRSALVGGTEKASAAFGV